MVVTRVSNPSGDVLHWIYLDVEGDQALVNNRIVRGDKASALFAGSLFFSETKQTYYDDTTNGANKVYMLELAGAVRLSF